MDLDAPTEEQLARAILLCRRHLDADLAELAERAPRGGSPREDPDVVVLGLDEDWQCVVRVELSTKDEVQVWLRVAGTPFFEASKWRDRYKVAELGLLEPLELLKPQAPDPN